MARQPLCIMAFGGHPPDVIGSAGGTLAKHARRGDVTVAVSLTDGTRHMNPSLSKHHVVGAEAIAQVAQVKRAEMERACEALGVQHVRFLGLRDSPLEVSAETLHAISDVIREFRPDVILTHHPDETHLTGHPDHGDAGRAVLRGYMLAIELGFESQRIPFFANSVYTYASGSTTCPGLGHLPDPMVYVDISDVIEAKKNALLAEVTMGHTEEAMSHWMAAQKGREGLLGVQYAEGFLPIHAQVIDYFERRTKGRWIFGAHPREWDTLSLWPDLAQGPAESQEETE
jgi:N-acetylglucosamine malate deacetylase 1